MDLIQVEWLDGMSCARSSGKAGVGDPSLGLGSLFLTCSSFTCLLNGDLGKGSRIFGG